MLHERGCCATTIPLLFVLLFASRGAAEQPEKVRVTERELWAALELDRPGLAGVRSAVDGDDLPAAAQAWAEYIAQRKKPTCHYDRDEWPRYIRENFPAVAEAMVREAERVVDGHVGHAFLQLPIEEPIPGGKIDWLHNPTRDTSYVSLVGSQWFMNPLGRAYLLTKDERFAKTFAWLFASWFDAQDTICANQGGLGFDPIYRAYYPGIRARILADNYYALANSSVLTPELHIQIMRQLLADARFLYRQEQRYRKGNQQVAAVLGLGIIGLVFPEFKESKQWLERAEAMMVEHLQNDFFNDGGHRELCTQYHKTCLRDITYVALTSLHNGRPSPLFVGENGKALERSFDWLARLIMPTGETPPLNSAVFSTDHAVYTLISAVHFQRSDHAFLAARFWRRNEVPTQKAPLAYAAYLLCSPLETSALRTAAAPDYLSTRFDTSGCLVMRTGWEPQDRYLLFQYGWANSGHAYPVTLSFLLEMNGELIATHAGSPRSYRHPAYRFCRSTRSHQTITIDGTSYPNVQGAAPGGRLDAFADLPGLWYANAHHEGYRPTIGAVHRRKIIFLKDGPLLVVDQVEGGRGHVAQWNFHTPLKIVAHPNQTMTLAGRHTYQLVFAHPDQLTKIDTYRHWAAVLPRNCQPDDCGAEVNGLSFEKPISPDRVQFAVAVFEGEGTIREPAPGVFHLAQESEEYSILLGCHDATIDGHRVVASGELVVVRFVNQQPRQAWIVAGTRLAVDGKELLTTEQPVTRALAVNGG